jgi:hypothetical protein
MTPTISLEDTVVALHQLHLLPLDLVLPPISNYQPKHIFFINKTLFTQALPDVPHLSLSGFFRMVYEHLLGCFIPKDPSSGFLELFQVAIVVVHGDMLKVMALMLGANILLVVVKDFGGIRLIIVNEMFLRLISHCLIASRVVL